MTGPALVIREASVQVADAILLRATNLEVLPGELWAVTGPNGSGKTTLLRAILGTRDLTTGACELMGQPIDLARLHHQRRLLAAAVDPMPIARDMTIREQVLLVASSWFGNTQESVRQSDSVVTELGLDALVDRFPHQLSAGQQQLFNLSLCLVRPASVILLDEPERHLDSDRVDLVAAALARRTGEGLSVMAATHEPAIVGAADHRLILDC